MLRPILVALTGVMLAATGCQTEPSQPPAPPPPPPDNTRNLAIASGNNQQAPVGQPVAIAPSVRVTNSTGGGVAGVSVTFAVAAGNGAVTGAVQTTDATGLATVGGWTLGPVPGPNTLTATAANGTNGPASFDAVAVELVLVPSKDTVLGGGVITAKRVDIPAGVTVTVNSALTLNVDSVAEIRGTLRGACVGMAIDARQGLLLQGTIDNGCVTPQDDPPPMQLVGRTGYEVDGGTVVTSGDFEITNDPTLTEADVPGPAGLAAALARAVPMGSQARVIGGCRLTAGRFSAGGTARMGTSSGRTGGNGGNGRRLWVSCRGNATVGAMTINAQHGGDGGKGTDNTINARSTGGRGGRGGEVRFLSTGSLTFDDRATITTGNGGKGGDAESIPSQPGSGLKASGAEADGGPGGEPGLFRVKAGGQIIFPVNTSQTFTIGKAGDGGDALAIAANGTNAGAQAAQAGGDADAEGGPGGSTPDKQLQGAAVAGGGRITVAGGDAGTGGKADATGGKGGDGVAPFRDGANGGDFRAQGGAGGDALLRDFNGAPVGDAGHGGDATVRNGVGGNGDGSCQVPLGPGGEGGEGGNGSGGGGAGGTVGGNPSAPIGAGGSPAHLVGNAGTDGTTVVRDEAGNGGNGGNGSGPGIRGNRGSDAVTKAKRTNMGTVFTPGKPGKGCVFTTQFAVKDDPQGQDEVLNLSSNPHPVRVTKLGTSIIIEFLDFQAGIASGTLTSTGDFRASGSFQILTPLGVRSGAILVTLRCDDATGTFTGTITMTGLPGGDVTYDVAGALAAP